MDIKSLKDKILQLAIQGKLVQQNENDEPASVLLEKIRQEKEQLIKYKVIKKEKPFLDITEEEKRFELPKGWEWVRLGQISNYIKAGGDKPKDFSTTKSVEYSIPVIANGKTNTGIVGYTKIATENNVCLTVSGRGTIGYSCIRKEPFCPIVRLIVISPSLSIDIRYLNYALHYFIEQGVGTSIQQLTVPMIKPKVIPLPPLQEQKCISDKIDEVFELIDELDNNKQDLLENISNTRNKVLQLAIQGKLVEQYEDDEPASMLLEKIKAEKEQLIKDKVIKKENPLPKIVDEEKLFNIPQSWEWRRLGEIGQIIGGGTPSSTNSEYYSEGGIPWLTPVDLRGYKDKYISNGNRFITELGLQKSSARMLPKGSVLFSSRAPIGYVAINDKELCTNQGFKSIVPYEVKMNEYIYYFLKYNIKNIEDMASGTTFKEISGKGMSEVVIPIPPLEEQKRIVAKVDLIMDYLDKLQQEIESQEIILEDILQ